MNLGEIENLSTIAVGDKVKFYSRIFHKDIKKTVIRVTPTTFTTDDGNRFKKDTGKMITGGSNYVFASRWSPLNESNIVLQAQREKEQKDKIIEKITSFPWSCQSIEKLQRVVRELKSLGIQI